MANALHARISPAVLDLIKRGGAADCDKFSDLIYNPTSPSTLTKCRIDVSGQSASLLLDDALLGLK